MNISDLNEFEVVNGSEVIGGGGYGGGKYYKKEYYKKPSINVAVATANAGAFGKNTLTITDSDAFVEEGVASISSSTSIAAAVGSSKKYKKDKKH